MRGLIVFFGARSPKGDEAEVTKPERGSALEVPICADARRT